MRINWNEPKFDEDELKEVSEVIKTNYVNEGPKTKELEEKLKEYLNVKNVILTTNATAALFLAIKADSIIKNIDDFEVIVPNMTMIATATSVYWAGGKPILVDVEKERGTIDVKKIEEKINKKTTAIIPVHILGRAVDINNLQNLADKYNLTIIEDAAGALGSKHNGRFLGTFSNKEFFHNEIGYNLKFNDLSAALALAQFRKLDERKKLLLEQRKFYEEKLKELEEINFFPLNEGEIPLWIDCIVKYRADLVNYLKSHEIDRKSVV